MKIDSAGDIFLLVIYLIEMYSSWYNKPYMIFNNECITLKSNIYCKIQKGGGIFLLKTHRLKTTIVDSLKYGLISWLRYIPCYQLTL